MTDADHDTPESTLAGVRDGLVEAMLPHVMFEGWSRRSLDAAVHDMGLDKSMALRAFPGGMAQAAEHYCDWLDRRMLEALADVDLDSMNIRQRIATVVRTRIGLVAPYRESVRRLISFLSLPINALASGRCTYRAVDSMWFAAGDTSTDWNFYTKRALLAGVYSATLLCWLADDSEDFEETWAFLDRRIEDALKLPRWPRRAADLMGTRFYGNPLAAFMPGSRRRGGRSFGMSRPPRGDVRRGA